MESKTTNNSNIAWIVCGVTVGIIVLAILIIQLSAGRTASSIDNFGKKYSISDVERPKMEASQKAVDLGRMKLSEERQTDIVIKNSGTKPLVINNVQTSCMCTFAKAIFKGEESPEFNMAMHNSVAARRWQIALQPNEELTIQGIYKPSVMPVQGPVERIISFDTNDPENPTVELLLTAYVE